MNIPFGSIGDGPQNPIGKKSRFATVILKKCAKYFEIARISLRNSLAYPIGLVGRSIWMFINMWIIIQLFQTAYASSGQTQIGGFTLAMTLWTLVFARCFQIGGKPKLAWEIDREVRTGTLVYRAQRPYSYILFHFFDFNGRNLLPIAICLCIGILTVGLWSGLFLLESKILFLDSCYLF